jgi:hypothetical protein
MRIQTLATVMALAAAAWAAPPNFTGTWVLNPGRSRNLGMMAKMQDTVTIHQTASVMVMRDAVVFQGQTMTRITRYELGGRRMANRSPTGDAAHTVSHWQGRSLVTLWEIEGSIAGTMHRRYERRYISTDGRTMTEISERSAGDRNPVVLVFDRH